MSVVQEIVLEVLSVFIDRKKEGRCENVGGCVSEFNKEKVTSVC